MYQIVSRGYLKCKKCGTVFTPAITDDPCYYSPGVSTSPGEWCIDCAKFERYANDNPKCPACGSNEYKRISGATARIINHFRK